MEKIILKKPNAINLELLIRAKLFLEHAISHSNSSGSIDTMLAIHELDNSIEYLLRIIINHLDIENLTGKNFESCNLSALAGEINRFLFENQKVHLPYLSEIKTIRQIRNLVQHGAINPKPDIERFAKITERFFDKVFNNIFDISKEELRVSSLIKNSEVKKHLDLAEKYIDNREFLLSIVSSRDAFENALFYKIKNTDIRMSSIPALVEMNKTNDKAYWFFDKISEEIELSRLSVNLNKYDKFSNYIRYIPSEYNADKRGHIIMERPWKLEDSKFCYSFVSETILKWQEEELEPIFNPIYPVDSYKSETKIGEVIISENLEYGCYYYFDSDSVVELIYVGKKEKENLDKLVPENEYLYSDKRFKEGNLCSTSESKIKLLNINKRLITNNPERWEISFWYDSIPFTHHRKEYKDGKVMEETPCINTASEEELINLNKDLITKELAKKIVAFRKVIGKINSKEDLKKINGINDEQITWLSRFIRL